MTAIIECELCKARLYFDTRSHNISPEQEGWIEIYLPDVSLSTNKRTGTVCPECIGRIAKMFKDYDPITMMQRKEALCSMKR